MGKYGKSTSGRSNSSRSRGKNKGKYIFSTSKKSSNKAKASSYGKSVQSNPRSHCFTKHGTKVLNPKAYSATGAPMYNSSGRRVNNPVKFSAAVSRNSINAAVKSAVKLNPRAKAFTYTLSLDGGKKYVGYTAYPIARMKAHTSSRGARVTQELSPYSIKITPHRSITAAKKAETETYYIVKAKHGGNKVRGAGNSSRFSFSTILSLRR